MGENSKKQKKNVQLIKTKYRRRKYYSKLLYFPKEFEPVLDYVCKQRGVKLSEFIYELVYREIGANSLREFLARNPGLVLDGDEITGASEVSLIDKRLQDMIERMYCSGKEISQIEQAVSEELKADCPKDDLFMALNQVVQNSWSWQRSALRAEYKLVFGDEFYCTYGQRKAPCVAQAVFGVDESNDTTLLGVYLFRERLDKGDGGFWHTVAKSLRSGGVERIGVVCADKKFDFGKSFIEVFTGAEIQTCINHLINDALQLDQSPAAYRLAASVRKACQMKQVEDALRMIKKEAESSKCKAAAKLFLDETEAFKELYRFNEEIRSLIMSNRVTEAYDSLFISAAEGSLAFKSLRDILSDSLFAYFQLTGVLEEFKESPHL